MLLAEARISSIGALNHRSTLLRMSSLPTMSTSTAGTSVIARSRATSLPLNLAKGSARLRSTTILTTLRPRTKSRATSIVRSATDSA